MPVYLAFGANQPATFNGQNLPPAQTFAEVLNMLEKAGITVRKTSHLWQSPAWPDPDAQPPYLNAVIEVETSLSPLNLLKELKRLETLFGRKRSVRNAARPLDLDILDYEGQVLSSPELTLPHPRMLSRPFVLFPLAEIAPDWCDPIKRRALTDWSARLELAEVTPLHRLASISAYKQSTRG